MKLGPLSLSGKLFELGCQGWQGGDQIRQGSGSVRQRLEGRLIGSGNTRDLRILRILAGLALTKTRILAQKRGVPIHFWLPIHAFVFTYLAQFDGIFLGIEL